MDWDYYFIDIAKAVSQRSPDPDTKHGCVIVDTQNRIVSTGYNGPVKEFPNDKVDYNRPDKYLWMIHAEDNAILFAQRDLNGCTAYITGHPCCNCMRRMAQAGIKRVVYGMIMSKCITDTEYKVINQMCKELNIEMLNIIDEV
jgi:dCMP deaminase